MGNKLVKYGLIKVIVVFPVSFLLFYVYYKYKISIFLYTSILFIILSAVECFLLARELYQSVSINKNSDMEISELKQRLSDQELCLEELAVLEKEIRLVQNDLALKDEELKALREASQMITSTFDTKNIVEYVYNVFNKFTSCDRYIICFSERNNGEKEKLICRYEYGSVNFDIIGRVFEKGTMIEKCYSMKKTVVDSNVVLGNRSVKGDRILIPLNVSGEGIGVICIESGIPETFSNINVDFFESLSTYLAIAIKNAELFGSTYLQKQEIEALYEETTAVNDELNRYIEELNETKEELKLKNGELLRYFDEIQTGYLQTVMALANSIEAKDPYTRGHCERVMEFSCKVARIMGYKDDEIEELRYAAILHDIGKIGISASILKKAGMLTDDEYNEIKKHPQIAYNILKDVLFIKNGLNGILQHHERYDGKGYPNGIKGQEICEFGRILCIADAFDAMTSDRPYRKGMSMQDAIKEVERSKGTQFDPYIADVFIKMIIKIIQEKVFEYQV